MSAPTLHQSAGGAAEHQEKSDAEVYYADTEKPVGNTREINAASVALAAAIEAQKPSLLSKNMLKLYLIMAIGYLVSTMNGFGTCILLVHPLSIADKY